MKKTILILLGISFTVISQAQKAKSFGVGLGAHIAHPGDFSHVASAGIGLQGLAEYSFSSKVSAIAELTYTEFLKKSGAHNNRIIALLPGVKVYPVAHLFINAQAGYGQLAPANVGGFTWQAGIGYVFTHLQLGARYSSWARDGESLGWPAFAATWKF